LFKKKSSGIFCDLGYFFWGGTIASEFVDPRADQVAGEATTGTPKDDGGRGLHFFSVVEGLA
jgi:hypothetical protein